MKNRTRSMVAVALVVAVGLTGGWAFAHARWGGWGHMYPGHMYEGDAWNLSPEQRQKIEAENQRYYQESAKLRAELYQKRLELEALLVDPKADPETIKAKQREIFEVERQLREKALDYRLALRDLFPEGYMGRGRCPYGPGFGPMMGYGGPYGWGPYAR